MLLSTESSRPRVIDTLSDEALNFHAKSKERNCWMKKNASAKFRSGYWIIKKLLECFCSLAICKYCSLYLKNMKLFIFAVIGRRAWVVDCCKKLNSNITNFRFIDAAVKSGALESWWKIYFCHRFASIENDLHSVVSWSRSIKIVPSLHMTWQVFLLLNVHMFTKNFTTFFERERKRSIWILRL